MPICTSCGFYNSSKSNFCASCGINLEEQIENANRKKVLSTVELLKDLYEEHKNILENRRVLGIYLREMMSEHDGDRLLLLKIYDAGICKDYDENFIPNNKSLDIKSFAAQLKSMVQSYGTDELRSANMILLWAKAMGVVIDKEVLDYAESLPTLGVGHITVPARTEPEQAPISEVVIPKPKQSNNKYIAIFALCALCLIGFMRFGNSDHDPYLKANVGDTLQFGRYYQSDDVRKEPLNWIVLDKDDDTMLLLSHKGIDTMPYNIKPGNVNWKTSSLRHWLNSDFYNTVFNYEEKRQISSSYLINEKNPWHEGSVAGPDTADRLFLLSIAEATKYFRNDPSRVVYITSYAMAQGADNTMRGTSWWWLRTPGSDSTCASFVHLNGRIDHLADCKVTDAGGAIRPAVRVKIQRQDY